MKKYEFPFEKLLVWAKAIDLVKAVYLVTRVFPKEEIYGITNQIRRCAVSVPSNIAEGSTRMSSKDKAHFTVIAYSSLMELDNQLLISIELEYLKEDDYENLRTKIEEIARMLIAFRNAQKSP